MQATDLFPSVFAQRFLARVSPGLALLLATALITSSTGCSFVSKSRLNGAEARNRSLTEQNRALLTQVDNLKGHTRTVEDRLIAAEEELALLEEEVGLDRVELADYQAERGALEEHLRSIQSGAHRLPEDVEGQLMALSDEHECLHFDPTTGISKLDTDILFNSGSAELKGSAERVIRGLVAVLNRDGAKDLKVLVVGHTDNQKIAKKPAREKHANNFHLSTARANAVADLMRDKGLTDHRVGVAGFGPHQPIASNSDPRARQKNRRVEIFIMASDVPVVGWTESIPTVYR